MTTDDDMVEFRACADAMERAIAARPGGVVRRAVVLAETASTQDAALAVAGGESGVLVVAGRQTAGRGRLGRAWVQRGGLGIACTLALRVGASRHAGAALAAGVAACRAIERALGRAGAVGIRWPNDVVERTTGRKVAGVLLESRAVPGAEACLLIGIGVNVAHLDADWPPDLAGRAASIRQLGVEATRPAVLGALVDELNGALRALNEPGGLWALVAAWRERDIVIGSVATFVVGGQEVTGRAIDLDPTLQLTLERPDGTRVLAPASSTRIVDPHDLRG